MRRTRIVVARLGGVLQGMITTVLEQQPDMDLLGQLPDLDGLTRFVREERPDCIVTRLDHRRLPRQCVDALAIQPRLLILGVVGDANDLELCEVRQQLHDVGVFGTDLLLELIRQPANGGGGPESDEGGDLGDA